MKIASISNSFKQIYLV